jgi:alkyl sulfatase BDS1-like metallo-beta-lactamase superfamily hydrolase
MSEPNLASARTRVVLARDFTDVDERWSVTVENGALSAVQGRLVGDRHAKVTLTRAALDQILLGEERTARSPSGTMAKSWPRVPGFLDEGDPVCAIVVPRASGRD